MKNDDSLSKGYFFPVTNMPIPQASNMKHKYKLTRQQNSGKLTFSWSTHNTAAKCNTDELDLLATLVFYE